MSQAIRRGNDLGCAAIQVFVKNASQWKGKTISPQEAEEFRRAHSESPIGPLVAHATYLINLAATNADNLARSKETMGDELDRCDTLGISGLVIHPGAHLGAGVDAGLEKIADSLAEVLEARPNNRTKVLLENTAGQGTLVGFELGHLATIRDRSGHSARIGVCVDTCHALAAGYALDEASGYDGFLSQIKTLFGLENLGCIHMNDSKFELGSNRDRHANIGQGEVPLGVFRRLVNDRELEGVPMILETPLGDDGDGHRHDLKRLKGLIES